MAIFNDPNWLSGPAPGMNTIAALSAPPLNIGMPDIAGATSAIQPQLRTKRTIGNVLSDLFSNTRDANGVPTSEKLVAFGNAIRNAGRIYRGDAPVDTLTPLREMRLAQENELRQNNARNAFADLLTNPNAEAEAALAQNDPASYMAYQKQQAGLQDSRMAPIGDALAGVMGLENPAEAFAQVAIATGLDPAISGKVVELLQQGVPAQAIAARFGYQSSKQGSLPGAVQNYAMYKQILETEGPAAAEDFLKFAASGQVISPAQAADDARADRQFALDVEKFELDREEKERKASGAADLTPTQRGNVAQKLKVLPSIRSQLQRVKELAKAMEDNDSFARGKVAGLLPGQLVGGDAEVFDRASDSLRQYIRGLTRTPGEGSMSDYESRLAAAILPSRWGSDEGRAESIAAMEALIASLESGYKEMLGQGAPAPRSGGSSAGRRVNPDHAARQRAIAAERARRAGRQ